MEVFMVVWRCPWWWYGGVHDGMGESMVVGMVVQGCPGGMGESMVVWGSPWWYGGVHGGMALDMGAVMMFFERMSLSCKDAMVT